MILVCCMLIVFAIYQFTVSLITKYSTNHKHEASTNWAQSSGSGANPSQQAGGNSTRYGKRKARLQRAGPIDEPTDFDHSAQCCDKWPQSTGPTSNRCDIYSQNSELKIDIDTSDETPDRASAAELRASSMQTVIDFGQTDDEKPNKDDRELVNIESVENVENIENEKQTHLETKHNAHNYYSRFQLKPKQADWAKAIKRVLNIEHAVKMFSRQDSITDEEFLRRMELRNGDSPIEAGANRAQEPEFISSRKLRRAEISM